MNDDDEFPHYDEGEDALAAAKGCFTAICLAALFWFVAWFVYLACFAE